MTKWTVVVEGGGANLYEVAERDGLFEACQVHVGLLNDRRVRVGTARDLDGALSLINRHSGRTIRSVD